MRSYTSGSPGTDGAIGEDMNNDNTETTMVKITGNTYACRGLLSDFGGAYDASSKSWTMAAAQWDEIGRAHV